MRGWKVLPTRADRGPTPRCRPRPTPRRDGTDGDKYKPLPLARLPSEVRYGQSAGGSRSRGPDRAQSVLVSRLGGTGVGGVRFRPPTNQSELARVTIALVAWALVGERLPPDEALAEVALVEVDVPVQSLDDCEEIVVVVTDERGRGRSVGSAGAVEFLPAHSAAAERPPVVEDPPVGALGHHDGVVARAGGGRGDVGLEVHWLPPDEALAEVALVEVDVPVQSLHDCEEIVVVVTDERGRGRSVGSAGAVEFLPAHSAAAERPPVVEDPPVGALGHHDGVVARAGGGRGDVGLEVHWLPPDEALAEVALVEVDVPVQSLHDCEEIVVVVTDERGRGRSVGSAGAVEFLPAHSAAAERPPVVEDPPVGALGHHDGVVARAGGGR